MFVLNHYHWNNQKHQFPNLQADLSLLPKLFLSLSLSFLKEDLVYHLHLYKQYQLIHQNDYVEWIFYPLMPCDSTTACICAGKSLLQRPQAIWMHRFLKNSLHVWHHGMLQLQKTSSMLHVITMSYHSNSQDPQHHKSHICCMSSIWLHVVVLYYPYLYGSITST